MNKLYMITVWLDGQYIEELNYTSQFARDSNAKDLRKLGYGTECWETTEDNYPATNFIA